MSLEQIIESERNRYVSFFVESRDKAIARNPSTVGELLISINNEELPYPYRYLRVDVTSKMSDGSTSMAEVRLGPAAGFEPTGFNFGALTVEIYPFSWDSVQLLFGSEPSHYKQLDGWITRWLDIHDENPPGPHNISQAIHSFSRAEQFGEWWAITGDFGTAPADALVECIELLVGQGMTRIILKDGRQ
jgi:hypothetical protein